MDAGSKKQKPDLIIGLNKAKFDFMTMALFKITEPLADKERFRVIIENSPELPDVRVTYYFD